VYLHTQLLINEILPDEPDPAAANALQEGLGGQFGEMRTMMQYLFQSINFRGDATSKPYKDLLQGIGTEEISHVELTTWSARRAPCQSMRQVTRGAARMSTTAAIWCSICFTTSCWKPPAGYRNAGSMR
jgi:hypothetical protein